MRFPWKKGFAAGFLVLLFGGLLAVNVAQGQPRTEYEKAKFKMAVGDVLSFTVKKGDRIEVVSGVLHERARILDAVGRDMVRMSRRSGQPLNLDGLWTVTLTYSRGGGILESYPVILRMRKSAELTGAPRRQ